MTYAENLSNYYKNRWFQMGMLLVLISGPVFLFHNYGAMNITTSAELTQWTNTSIIIGIFLFLGFLMCAYAWHQIKNQI